jgi:hypothetical protein
MLAPRKVTLAALGALLLLAAACGPSFQVIYENDARFEHCYALDESPNVSLQVKTDCWAQWVQHYSYGQTRNRTDYAAMRAAALQEVHALPTDEAIMGAAPGGGTGSDRVNEPAPTSAFTSPPKTLSEVDGGDKASSGPTAMPRVEVSAPTFVATPSAPQDECSSGCRAAWGGCHETCKAAVCAACDKAYAKCMKACF